MYFGRKNEYRIPHYLLVALQALFVDKGLIEEELAKEFHETMVLRESADYHGEFSKEGAQSSIESATKFLEKARGILQ